ncbi:hypothetical protein D3C86_1807640 [compost metagenome]
MHHVRNAALPAGQGRSDRRPRRQTPEQSHPDQSENAQPEQAMQPEKQSSQRVPLGQQALDFDAGINADKQRQHQPVQGDRQCSIPLSR